MEIKEHKFDGKIMALYALDRVYVGVANKMMDFSNGKILCRHEKSIRYISGNNTYIGCCSYDGKATVIDSMMDNLIEVIEGPDTEIKGIAFNDDLIALSTRGRTVWILEDFEISKILDDHLQDVKGCCFFNKRLYSWSYDNTIKMYELFIDEHSWELIQSVDLGDIVWSVIFYNDWMCALLQSGELVGFKMKGGIWTKEKTVKLSAYPIFTGCICREHLYIVCNRNVPVKLNKDLEVIHEHDPLSDGFDILCSCFSEKFKSIFFGCENGVLYQMKIE